MGQRSPHFEWQTGEEEWQTSPALGMRPRQLAGLRDWPLRWRLAAVTLLVCVLGGGGWLWYRAESGLAAIREELATAVQTEFWSAVQGTPGWTVPKDGETSTTWQAQFAHESVQQRLIMGSDALKRQELADVQVVVLHNDIAAVHIVTSQQSDGQLYRQTRFYRHTDKGWQRTMPDESLWGTQHSLESNYFIVNYRQQDADVVTRVMPQLDKLYTTLGNNFGQSSLLKEPKLIIEVSVKVPPGPASVNRDQLLQIPSPALYLAPGNVTDDQLLLQPIALALINHVLLQVKVLRGWQPLLDGLRLWQLWDLNLPLSAWQNEVVTWVYRDTPKIQSEQPLVFPEWFRPLCAKYSLWMEPPAQVGIPLLCNSEDHSDWDRLLRYLYVPSRQLAQLDVPVFWDARQTDYQDLMHNSGRPGQAVALATLIEFAVDTYGHERLPLMASSLDRYDNWETLLPQVFGVSRSEFETGWQSYLVMHDRDKEVTK